MNLLPISWNRHVTRRRHSSGLARACRERKRDSRVLIELLEQRIAPAFTVTLVGTVASFQGSGTTDTLSISESGGLLQHNRAGDPGFADAFDFDTTQAGSQHLSATSASVINVDDGGGADTVLETRSTDFVAGTIHAPGGTIRLTSTGGAITAGTTGPLTASTLSLSAVSGIGANGAAISTAVNGVVGLTVNGGIFINNMGVLTIGFAGDPFQGVRVTNTGSIVLNCDSTINVTRNAVANEIISAPGDVMVTASGASSDIVTGENQNTFGNPNNALKGTIVSTGGNVSLSAGRDLLIGNNSAANLFGNVLAGGNLALNAARNINIDSFSFVFASAFSSNPGASVVATAGANISLLQSNGSTGATIQTGGGSVSLTTGALGVFTASSGVGNGDIQSNGGTITLTADDVVINDRINAGTGVVALHQVSQNRVIDLGSNTPGRMGLTDAELDHFSALTLRIGNVGPQSSPFVGGIAISAPITQAGGGYSFLSLNADKGNLTQNGGATIAVSALAAQGGDVILTEAGNTVGTLAGSTSAFVQFGFSFTNSSSMTVGTVDGVVGIKAVNPLFGDITLTGAAGTQLTVSQPITTPNGRITLNFDDMSINANIVAPSQGLFGPQLEGHVNLLPVTAGRQIDLGTDTIGKLGLTDAELDHITAGTSLVIGTPVSGNIAVTNQIHSTGSYGTLSLKTGGTIVDGNNTEPDITVASLSLQTNGAFTLDTAVSILAFSNSSGAVTILNTGNLSLHAVDTTSSSTNSGTTTSLTATGSITIASNVISAGTLTVTATDAAAAGNDIFLNAGVVVSSTSGDVSLRAGDNLTVASGALVSSPGQIAITGDFGNQDAGVGATVRLLGTFAASNPVSVSGGPDRDTFIVVPSTVQGFTIAGGAPSVSPGDTLVVDVHGNTPAVTHLTANSGSVSVPGFAPVSFSEIEVIKFLNLPARFVPSSSPYGSATNYSAHTSPRSVVLSDVNGDGIPDLLVANYGSHDISVMLGVGDGTFLPAVNFDAGGNHPIAIAVADFNHDNKPDLAVANVGSNNVGILLGNGDGTFQPATKLAVGKSPASLKIADVNGDGAFDILTANSGSSNFSVLLGQGNGSFNAATNFKTAFTSPRDLVIGDFNNDGKQDIVVASTTGLSYFKGDGSGTFATAPVKIGTGASIASIAAGDFNGDGNLDLVVTNSGSRFISVLLGNGSAAGAQFKPALRVQSALGYQSVVVQDFDGDGIPDIALANSTTQSLDILLGVGNGTFSAPFKFPVGGVGSKQPVSVAVADLNGDGRLDLVVAAPLTNEVSVLLRVS